MIFAAVFDPITFQSQVNAILPIAASLPCQPERLASRNSLSPGQTGAERQILVFILRKMVERSRRAFFPWKFGAARMRIKNSRVSLRRERRRAITCNFVAKCSSTTCREQRTGSQFRK
jgi:hypothetical protein